MIVGTCTIELYIPASQSLKNKRSILQSIVRRVQNEFNVSIAEVDANDMWQSAVLGIACVSNDTAHANRELSKIVDFIEDGRFEAQIATYQIEIF